MQTVAAQEPAAADPRLATAAERAQKEGNKVFMRILRNGATARRIGPAAAPDPAPAAAPAPPPAPPPAIAKAPTPAHAVKPRERPALAEATPPAARPDAPSPPAAPAKPRTATLAPTEDAASAPPLPLPLPLPPVPPPMAYTAAPAASEPQEEEEDPPLVVVHQVEPEFPISILRRQKKGGVVVRFVVQPDGSVTQPEIVKSTNPYLNPYAIQAVAQWKFQPLPREQSAMAELNFDLRQALSE
ncbi:TonB family protein [Roseateles sp.]|uniref:TonB family protein n=1 Tax=Roseateles sp. TaxID=1971397 RepID=UPI0032632102